MSQAYNALLELPLPDGDDDEDADFAREDALFVVREMLTVAKVRFSLPVPPPLISLAYIATPASRSSTTPMKLDAAVCSLLSATW